MFIIQKRLLSVWRSHYSSFAGRTYRSIKNDVRPFKRNQFGTWGREPIIRYRRIRLAALWRATDNNGHGWNVNGETMHFIGYRKQTSQKIHEITIARWPPLDPCGWFIMRILGTNKVETKFNKIITMIYDQLPKDTSYTAGILILCYPTTSSTYYGFQVFSSRTVCREHWWVFNALFSCR